MRGCWHPFEPDARVSVLPDTVQSDYLRIIQTERDSRRTLAWFLLLPHALRRAFTAKLSALFRYPVFRDRVVGGVVLCGAVEGCDLYRTLPGASTLFAFFLHGLRFLRNISNLIDIIGQRSAPARVRGWIFSRAWRSFSAPGHLDAYALGQFR